MCLCVFLLHIFSTVMLLLIAKQVEIALALVKFLLKQSSHVSLWPPTKTFHSFYTARNSDPFVVVSVMICDFGYKSLLLLLALCYFFILCLLRSLCLCFILKFCSSWGVRYFCFPPSFSSPPLSESPVCYYPPLRRV